MNGVFDPGGCRFHCPGCGRVLDGSGLRAGERFKCGKCKKLMRFGPHLLSPDYAEQWRTLRTVLLVGCVAATVWVVAAGYELGYHTERWARGFGGALLMWFVVAGCIGLAARTTQNNGVLVGVTALMSGLALLFVARLSRHVGYNGESGWSRSFAALSPVVATVGAAVLVASLVIQARTQSV
ncbi:MAG: hypothetical protein ACLF0G_09500 [Candidatus Brocadiia bacterium]